MTSTIASTMSSETSIDAAACRGARLQADDGRRADQSLRPWQFFVLAGLGCATAVVFVARGRGLTVVVLLSLLEPFAATLDKSDPTYVTRMAGLDGVKRATAGGVLASLGMLSNRADFSS